MKKLLIGALVTGLVAMLTIGAASAAGHAPVTFSHDTDNQQDNDADQPEATEAAEPSETPEATEAPEPTDAPEAADSEDSGDQSAGADTATGDNGTQVAQVIADHFGVSQADVMALHDQGIGFGAIFKLYAIAAAK